jgi:thymidylate kinase
VTLTDEALVANSSAGHLSRNAVPTAAQAGDRDRARLLIRTGLEDLLTTDGVTGSPAGTAWTAVFEARVTAMPDEEHLLGLGWLHLDDLLTCIGEPSGGRWAVVADSRVLAGVHISTEDAADPVPAVVERATRRREVRLVDVLELRALLRQGHRFPAASAVVRTAADIESGLGGRELVRWTSGRRLAAPAALPSVPGSMRKRYVVSISGVDGSGKTTLMDALTTDLENAGVPTSRVWLRPGMGLGWIAALAGRVKRLLGADPRPGVGVLAADPDSVLPSRRGVQGWVWSLIVVTAFVVGVRRQHRASSGVVLYDRHVADALATLDFAYAGTNLALQRWMVTTFTPSADVAFYLDIPADVALARKPGDVIGAAAVRRQLEAYGSLLPRLRGVRRLDATRAPHELRSDAIAQLCSVGTADRESGAPR